MKWPDFIIAGCMKCGTTALRRNLRENPVVVVVNETNFWLKSKSDHYTKGYQALFPIDKMAGEKCAIYYDNEKVMMRIAAAIPECKIILCIRNPVDRLYSEFNMKRRQGFKRGEFSADKMWGTRYSHMLKKGLYYTKFVPIYSMFPRRNIHIVVQEWMAADTRKVTGEVFDFLEVCGVEREVLDIDGNWKDKREVHVDGYYERWERSDYPPMNKDTRKALLDYYVKPNERLWDLLKFEVKQWRR